jgi:3-methyladenine DNA glycosylase AlkC
MAEPLKNMYNPAFFEKLCPVLSDSIPNFDCRRFIHHVFNNKWPDLELKERVNHIAVALHNFLPKEFPKAAELLVTLSQKLKKDAQSEQGFAVIFIPDYIQIYGLDYPSESLLALEEITKLVSAEFAIRPFLLRYPEQTLAAMLKWSKHPEANVRRLSSEGCRPRLPWAMGVPFLKKDPTKILAILKNLKSDPSEYVRRSVANNLNDIAKDHALLVLKIASEWQGKNANTDWIIRHGCRTLLKRGNQEALSLHGFNPKSKSKIEDLTLSKSKVKIGEVLNFDFKFVNQEKKSAFFRLEYAIDYLTSTGKISQKVFKVTENNFPPGEIIPIKRKQSFQNFTTRKHFRGKHTISILSNGKKLASKEFMVS